MKKEAEKETLQSTKADSNKPHSQLLGAYLEDKSKEEILNLFIKHLKEEHKLTADEIHKLIKEEEKEISLPVSIFDNEKLSALETIAKYLKENKELRFNEIGKLLNRDSRCMWTTYANAKKKMPEPLTVKPSKIFIPITIFSERKLSVLESIVKFLKEKLELKLHDIAVLLNRNDRTVWTVYNRATKKK